MNELYNHPKVKVMTSLTKGEGFGRPLLEFSLTGKPIMASYWSGHLDFLHPRANLFISGEFEPVHTSAANKWLTGESKWFKPNDMEVGNAWDSLFKNYSRASKESKKQIKHAQEAFSFDAMKSLIDTTLEDNLPHFPKQIELNIPNQKISLPQLQKV